MSPAESLRYFKFGKQTCNSCKFYSPDPFSSAFGAGSEGLTSASFPPSAALTSGLLVVSPDGEGFLVS